MAAILPVRFTFQNALESAVSEHGIKAADLDESAAVQAMQAFRSRVDRGEIGFPVLPLDSNTAKEIETYADKQRGQFETVLLIGIGGSALGPFALDAAIRGPHPVQTGIDRKNPRLVVLDNVDPGFIDAALANVNPKKTIVLVVGKSGGTAETMSVFMIVHEWLTRAIGSRRTAQRIVAITDPYKGDLLAIAQQEKYATFHIPPNVGGRFSVFSPVGLVPAALIGLDISKLLRGARDANQISWSAKVAENPALQSAFVHYLLDTKHAKKIEVVFAYSSYLWASAFWYRQLWAESLGKRVNRRGEVVNTGQTPIAALGVTDQHSQVQLYMEGPNDKLITFWAVDRPRVEVRIPPVKQLSKFDSVGYLQGKTFAQLFTAERLATEAALTEAGRPNCRWTLPRVDEYHIGMLFQLLCFQTGFCGEFYGIDAFDQPGVELAKKLTNGLMGKKGFEEYATRFKKS